MVNWQLAKKRSGSRKTQERSEVTGSRAKIVRQKGSGGGRVMGTEKFLNLEEEVLLMDQE